jgi:predicted metal-dependent hydrolase
MAYKVFLLDDGKEVKIYKRKKAKNLRLSIDPKGVIKVSIPIWAPYKTGLDFARSRREWISDNHKLKAVLEDNQAIGKAHHLSFVASAERTSVTSRISGSSITVSHPLSIDASDDEVQVVAEKACIRALRQEAEALLPQRLETLANKYGFTYKSCSIKNLKSRWGSCDQSKNIVLSLFLMQMPWELIDYVLMHELTHTNVLRHGPPFWQAMEANLPGSKIYKTKLRAYQPVLMVR